jgi:hypothetical protein
VGHEKPLTLLVVIVVILMLMAVGAGVNAISATYHLLFTSPSPEFGGEIAFMNWSLFAGAVALVIIISRWSNKRALGYIHGDCTISRVTSDDEMRPAVRSDGIAGYAHTFTFTNGRYADLFKTANHGR